MYSSNGPNTPPLVATHLRRDGSSVSEGTPAISAVDGVAEIWFGCHVRVEGLHIVPRGVSPPGFKFLGRTTPDIDEGAFSLNIHARSINPQQSALLQILSTTIEGGVQWLPLHEAKGLEVDYLTFSGNFDEITVIIHGTVTSPNPSSSATIVNGEPSGATEQEVMGLAIEWPISAYASYYQASHEEWVAMMERALASAKRLDEVPKVESSPSETTSWFNSQPAVQRKRQRETELESAATTSSLKQFGLGSRVFSDPWEQLFKIAPYNADSSNNNLSWNISAEDLAERLRGRISTRASAASLAALVEIIFSLEPISGSPASSQAASDAITKQISFFTQLSAAMESSWGEKREQVAEDQTTEVSNVLDAEAIDMLTQYILSGLRLLLKWSTGEYEPIMAMVTDISKRAELFVEFGEMLLSCVRLSMMLKITSNPILQNDGASILFSLLDLQPSLPAPLLKNLLWSFVHSFFLPVMSSVWIQPPSEYSTAQTPYQSLLYTMATMRISSSLLPPCKLLLHGVGWLKAVESVHSCGESLLETLDIFWETLGMLHQLTLVLSPGAEERTGALTKTLYGARTDIIEEESDHEDAEIDVAETTAGKVREISSRLQSLTKDVLHATQHSLLPKMTNLLKTWNVASAMWNELKSNNREEYSSDVLMSLSKCDWVRSLALMGGVRRALVDMSIVSNWCDSAWWGENIDSTHQDGDCSLERVRLNVETVFEQLLSLTHALPGCETLWLSSPEPSTALVAQFGSGAELREAVIGRTNLSLPPTVNNDESMWLHWGIRITASQRIIQLFDDVEQGCSNVLLPLLTTSNLSPEQISSVSTVQKRVSILHDVHKIPALKSVVEKSWGTYFCRVWMRLMAKIFESKTFSVPSLDTNTPHMKLLREFLDVSLCIIEGVMISCIPTESLIPSLTRFHKIFFKTPYEPTNIITATIMLSLQRILSTTSTMTFNPVVLRDFNIGVHLPQNAQYFCGELLYSRAESLQKLSSLRGKSQSASASSASEILYLLTSLLRWQTVQWTTVLASPCVESPSYIAGLTKSLTHVCTQKMIADAVRAAQSLSTMTLWSTAVEVLADWLLLAEEWTISLSKNSFTFGVQELDSLAQVVCSFFSIFGSSSIQQIPAETVARGIHLSQRLAEMITIHISSHEAVSTVISTLLQRMTSSSFSSPARLVTFEWFAMLLRTRVCLDDENSSSSTPRISLCCWKLGISKAFLNIAKDASKRSAVSTVLSPLIGLATTTSSPSALPAAIDLCESLAKLETAKPDASSELSSLATVTGVASGLTRTQLASTLCDSLRRLLRRLIGNFSTGPRSSSLRQSAAKARAVVESSVVRMLHCISSLVQRSPLWAFDLMSSGIIALLFSAIHGELLPSLSALQLLSTMYTTTTRLCTALAVNPILLLPLLQARKVKVSTVEGVLTTLRKMAHAIASGLVSLLPAILKRHQESSVALQIGLRVLHRLPRALYWSRFFSLLATTGEGFTLEFLAVRLWVAAEDGFQAFNEAREVARLWSTSNEERNTTATLSGEEVRRLLSDTHLQLSVSIAALAAILDVCMWAYESGRLPLSLLARSMRATLVDPKKALLRLQRAYVVWTSAADISLANSSHNDQSTEANLISSVLSRITSSQFVNLAADSFAMPCMGSAYSLSVESIDDARHVMTSTALSALVELSTRYARHASARIDRITVPLGTAAAACKELSSDVWSAAEMVNLEAPFSSLGISRQQFFSVRHAINRLPQGDVSAAQGSDLFFRDAFRVLLSPMVNGEPSAVSFVTICGDGLQTLRQISTSRARDWLDKQLKVLMSPRTRPANSILSPTRYHQPSTTTAASTSEEYDPTADFNGVPPSYVPMTSSYVQPPSFASNAAQMPPGGYY